MRKCRSCGYLLLGEGDSCKRCGAPLPVVSAAAGAATSAATGFGRLSIPSPAPSVPAESLPALREAWRPVAMPPSIAAPRSSRSGLIAVGLAIALVVVLGAGVLHLRSDSLPSGTQDFVAGKGVAFTSPDGVYRAKFPQAATTETVPPTTGSALTLERAYAKTDSYEIVTVSSIAPAAVPSASANVLLEAGLAAEIANLNGKLQSKHETTFAGMPAIEGSFKGSDGYQARILVVASGANVFEVVVHAKSGAGKLFEAFKSSLIIF